MTKPTPKQLLAEFNRLKELNRPGRHKGSFSHIADEFGYSPLAIKFLLQNRVNTWRPHHYQIWQACKSYVKKC